jgi:selenocysteine lyase/cysteine desulfurase
MTASRCATARAVRGVLCALSCERSDDMDLRDQFPQTREVIYLNTGTVGLCPLPVVEALLERVRAFEVAGQLGWGAAEAAMNEGRARLASWLGAASDDLALTRNATDGTNLVAAGIDWRPGDEVLLSGEEHPSMELPWHYLQQQGRIRLNRFAVSADPVATLAAAEAALTPRTRLLATSHVFSHSGNRAPAAALVALCRARGVLLHLDGAQAVGQFPLDLTALGADFYTGNCHKWLLGPKGTGFLHIRPESREHLRPVFVGAGSATSFSPEAGLTFPEGARRFEYATRDFAKYAALEPLMGWWEAIGAPAAEARLRELAAYARQRLEEVPGLTFHTASAWEDSSAMLTFSRAGRTTDELTTYLWEQHRVLTRPVSQWEAVRLSTALFNTTDEIDRVADALKRL